MNKIGSGILFANRVICLNLEAENLITAELGGFLMPVYLFEGGFNFKVGHSFWSSNERLTEVVFGLLHF